MVTFVVAYSVVWLALILYVARLGVRQRQLMRIAGELQSQTEKAALGGAEQRSERAA